MGSFNAVALRASFLLGNATALRAAMFGACLYAGSTLVVEWKQCADVHVGWPFDMLVVGRHAAAAAAAAAHRSDCTLEQLHLV